MKKILCISICVIMLVSLGSCTKTENIYEPTQPTTQETTIPVTDISDPFQETTAQTDAQITFTQTVSQTVTVNVPPTIPTPVNPQETETSVNTTVPQTTKTLEKTGEMEFSDDESNKYITAVSEKYSVNAQNLCALYTVPENDSNIVLEFDGTKNIDGTPRRDKSTLVAIYSIDRELNSKRASQNTKLNEYSYGEMKVMFFSVTTYIMPEFTEFG